MDVNQNNPLFGILASIAIWSVSLSGAPGSDDGFPALPEASLTTLSTPTSELPAATLSVRDEADSPWHWHIRPRGFVYDTYWASAAEPRLATHLIEEKDDGSFLDSHIGGRFGILRFGPKDRPEGFQLDLLGGAKLRQDWDEGLDVLATDYRYDLIGTYGAGPSRFKFGFYHVSSHAGDELLLRDPGFHRLNYFRNALVAGYSHFPIPQARFYAETGWAFDFEISKPWEFQLGVDLGPHNSTGVEGAPFLAMNVHLREELDFGGNLAVQTGWAWRGDDTLDGILRTGVYFYEGASPHFSFFADHERQIGWGLWYDF